MTFFPLYAGAHNRSELITLDTHIALNERVRHAGDDGVPLIGTVSNTHTYGDQTTDFDVVGCCLIDEIVRNNVRAAAV